MHQNPFKHAARAFFSPNKNLDISEYWYSTEACNLFHPKKEFYSSVHNCLVQRIKSFSKSLDYINGWYDCVEGGEEKNSNIPEYDIAIIKANIFSLKYLYELSIHYFGFDNDELKTCTE